MIPLVSKSTFSSQPIASVELVRTAETAALFGIKWALQCPWSGLQKAVFPVVLWGILAEKPKADQAGKDSWKVGHLQSQSCHKDRNCLLVDSLSHLGSSYRDVWVSEAKSVDGPGGGGEEGGNGQ